MFNLPYISYGIFAFVLIAVGLLAWKKGFMAALCSLFLTFATIGTIIGVVYGVYNHISPLFSTLIQKHFGGDGSYDFAYMANAAKPQVIAICIAVGFVPVFAVLFVITYPLYRFLKKRDFPIAVALIGTNSKKIKTQNKKLNKSLSVAASSVSAVLSAGFVSSATGVAFTTSSSYNGFNKFSSWLSFGTSYGFSQDKLSLHKMYDFVPLTKDAALMKLGQVIAPSSKGMLTSQEVQAILDSKDFAKLRDLISSSETEVLLNTLVSPFIKNTETIQYPLLDANPSVLSNKWRPLGNESAQKAGGNVVTPYLPDLAALKNLYSNVYFGFDQTTTKTITDWMKQNAIQSFKDTEADKLVERNKVDLKDIGTKLSDAKQKLQRFNSYLAQLASQRGSLVGSIKSTLSKMNEAINSYNDIISPSGNLETQKNIVASAKAVETSKHDSMETAGNEFETFTGYQAAQYYDVNKAPALGGVVSNANAEYQLAISSLVSSEAELSQAKTNAQAAVATVNSLTQQSTNLGAQITKLENERGPLQQTSLPAADATQQKAYTEKVTAETTFNQIDSDLTSLRTQLQTAVDNNNQAEIINLTQQVNAKQSQWATADSEKTRTSKAYDDAKRSYDDLNHKINDLTNQITTIQGQQNGVNNQKLQAEIERDSAVSAQQAAQQTRDNAFKTKSTAEITAKDKLKTFIDAYAPWKKAKQDLDGAQIALKNAIKAANQYIANFNMAFSDYKSKELQFENVLAQIAILNWNSTISNGKYVEIIHDILLSFADSDSSGGQKGYYDKVENDPIALSPDGLSFVNTLAIDGASAIKSAKTTSDYNISKALKDVTLDKNVWKNDEDVKHDLANVSDAYLLSKPSLEAIPDGNHQTITPKPYLQGGQPVVIDGKTPLYKNADEIEEGTEGLIAVLEYNQNEKQSDIENILTPFRNSQKELYDKNVAEYIDFFILHFGIKS